MLILVALFVEQEDLNLVLSEIKNKFNVQANKIFVLSQQDEEEELILTFNIELQENQKQDLKIGDFGKLIRIHRHKLTNCLYTINALNFLIKEEGEMNWEKYKFSFLTISNNHIKVIKTVLKEIIDLEKIND